MTEIFLMFIIYSVIGWVVEITFNLIQNKKIVDRGFLIGPYCPIYGYGALILIIFLNKYSEDPTTLFFMATILFSVLEYGTSYFMEKIFKARWWDYTEYKFNINGRIALETMVPFGLLALITMYIINPAIMNIFNLISPFTLNILAIITFVLFLADNIISYKIIKEFKNITTFEIKDNTEEISKKIKEILMKKSILYRRLVKAFPKFNIKSKL